MSPENQWLEDVFPIKIVFLGDILVFGGCNCFFSVWKSMFFLGNQNDVSTV